MDKVVAEPAAMAAAGSPPDTIGAKAATGRSRVAKGCRFGVFVSVSHRWVLSKLVLRWWCAQRPQAGE
jgi:hypothetical protein